MACSKPILFDQSAFNGDPRKGSNAHWAQGQLEEVEQSKSVMAFVTRGCGQPPLLHHAASPWRLEPGSSQTK